MTGSSPPEYVISSLSAFILKLITINSTVDIATRIQFPKWYGIVPETQLYHG